MPYLKVITGPMFSGKSEELIRLLNREVYAKKKVIVIKPAKDNRTRDKFSIAARKKTRNGKFEEFIAFDAFPVGSLKEAVDFIERKKPDVLGIDEAQFFERWIWKLIKKILKEKQDIKILIAGLDMTAWGEPFDSIPVLLALADDVVKLKAICFECGGEAPMTQKISGTEEKVEVGDSDKYEARCRKCHFLYKK